MRVLRAQAGDAAQRRPEPGQIRCLGQQQLLEQGESSAGRAAAPLCLRVVGTGLRPAITAREAAVVDMHANQLTVSAGTVRRLVDEQFPEWRSLPIKSIASQGTVNAIFRLGDRFAVRCPLEPGDVELTRRWLAAEAEAARELAGRTRFPTPEPVALGNVLVSGGRLAGILDVGGFGPADPAVDLVGAWHLLEAGPRRVLREHLGCDDLEWERGKAWAFEQAMGAAWYYRESNPAMSRMGIRTLAQISADPQR